MHTFSGHPQGTADTGRGWPQGRLRTRGNFPKLGDNIHAKSWILYFLLEHFFNLSETKR